MEDDDDRYERQLRARARRWKIAYAIGALFPVFAIVAWRGYVLYERVDRHVEPPVAREAEVPRFTYADRELLEARGEPTRDLLARMILLEPPGSLGSEPDPAFRAVRCTPEMRALDDAAVARARGAAVDDAPLRGAIERADAQLRRRCGER